MSDASGSMLETRAHQSSAAQRSTLKVAAALWIIWGLAHMAFGGLGIVGLVGGDAVGVMQAMAGGADPRSLEIDYPPAVIAILKQHSWNLLWFGLFTTAGAVWIWQQNRKAIVLTALIGGFADFGYFAFVDLGGYAAPPGPQMTWISAAAIALSMFVYVRSAKS